jgi:hypothetical protein
MYIVGLVFFVFWLWLQRTKESNYEIKKLPADILLIPEEQQFLKV